MARRIFFSFHYERDAWRAGVVRNSNVIRGFDAAGFIDAAAWESIKRQGDEAIKRWINNQLFGTSVTVVLIGAETASRPWVQYEIQTSWDKGNMLMGVRIHGIRDSRQQTDFLGRDPFTALGFQEIPIYDWAQQDGYNNLGGWIEYVARGPRK